MSGPGKTVRIMLCGASLKGNLGAPAMYDSIIGELSNYLPQMEVSVLSKYPNDDREECKKRGYHMIAFPTIKQLIQGGLFFLAGGLLKALHIPCRKLAGHGVIEAYYTNDIIIDASGISFTDERSLSNTLINSLWFLPGIISGIPMVKMSQSMGPYRKWYVRMAAGIVLKRLEFIVCRGNLSYELTKKLLPQKKIYNLPDTAFCLKAADDGTVRRLLDGYQMQTGEYIAIGPSFVMRDYFSPGVYSDIIAGAINTLAEKSDRPILFIPHSWLHKEQIGADTVNDDLSVCREIISKLDRIVQYSVIDEELSAREIKGIIGQAYAAMGSRYHFLIAALSSGIPSMALGWSHKYKEVFQEFGIDDMVLEYQGMNKQNVKELAEKLMADRDSIKERIEIKLKDVIQKSSENEKLVFDLLKEKDIV